MSTEGPGASQRSDQAPARSKPGHEHEHPFPPFKLQLLEKMKRHDLVRVAILYVVTCYVILHPIELVVQLLELPAWVGRSIVLVMAAGFPVVLLFAWIYGIAPDAHRAEGTPDPADAATSRRGRKLNRAIVVAMSIALAYLVADKFWPSRHLLTSGKGARASTAAANSGGRSEAAVATPRGRSTSAAPTVAVLPLANLSGRPERAYYTDGLTEDLIGALGRYSGLRVISASSVEQFKNRAATTDEIRRALGARYVVRGSVGEAGRHLRIRVELSDTDDGYVLWSDRFDGDDHAIFDIQDRIVRTIVGKLAVKVTRLEQERAAVRPPRNIAAYDLVLRARELVVRSERSANREARALLDRARTLAPSYAMADVVSAEAEYQRANFGWVEDTTQALRRAEQASRHALTIDDPGASARAHGLLALVCAMDGRMDQALAESNLAIAANPSDAFAFDARGSILLWLGRSDEAIESIQTALALDPAGRSSGTGFTLALAQYTAGRNEAAVAAADTTLARYPRAAFVHAVRAAALAELGDLEEARRAAEQVRALDPFFPSRAFGSRFVDQRQMAHLQEGLRRAGL
jgi:adenylate cyclase